MGILLTLAILSILGVVVGVLLASAFEDNVGILVFFFFGLMTLGVVVKICYLIN